MALGLNKVILIGNLGRDPETRFTTSGAAVSNMRLAISERRKKGDGWEDHTEWVQVVAFGKTAEKCGEYLSKGRQICVEGRMQTKSYEKDGVTKYSTEVVADQVRFLGGGNRDETAAPRGRADTGGDDLGDLPF